MRSTLRVRYTLEDIFICAPVFRKCVLNRICILPFGSKSARALQVGLGFYHIHRVNVEEDTRAIELGPIWGTYFASAYDDRVS